MKMLFIIVVAFASVAFAQDSKSSADPKPDKDQITVQGCVSRENGDYILMKEDPGISYELQATGKIRMHDYLGQRVEVSGEKSPTMSSSSDAMNRVGSASPVTITVRSIKTISKECRER
jgi:uncharacterized protein YpuA (DUF1002 family)